jgi:hypothetical protein
VIRANEYNIPRLRRRAPAHDCKTHQHIIDSEMAVLPSLMLRDGTHEPLVYASAYNDPGEVRKVCGRAVTATRPVCFAGTSEVKHWGLE